MTSTIVFLHIPKTAGQTIHTELVRAVGSAAVSPVRVHTQAPADAQMPPGYRLYSGHIDWIALETLPDDRFVFTVLRDPRERIASFYFYLRDQAARLSPEELETPQRRGMKMALTTSADEYFFGGDTEWQRFVRDHYDNFYVSYLATRRMRGQRQIDGLDDETRLARARSNLGALDRVYGMQDLGRLERDLGARLGTPLNVAGTRVNAGPGDRGSLRWPQLLDRFDEASNAALLEAFCRLDLTLMEGLGLWPSPAGRLES